VDVGYSRDSPAARQDFAPFNYEVGGVVSGPAADIIRKICSDIKIVCSFNLLE
jgi:hypothetical protein